MSNVQSQSTIIHNIMYHFSSQLAATQEMHFCILIKIDLFQVSTKSMPQVAYILNLCFHQ